LTQWRRKIRTTLRQDILERREIIKIFLRVAGIEPESNRKFWRAAIEILKPNLILIIFLGLRFSTRNGKVMVREEFLRLWNIRKLD
jgi:hypothetical protein